MNAIASPPDAAIAELPSLERPHAVRSPIFILGSPRSGTTMLARLLQDTDWGEPFETHFIPKYYRMLFRFGPLSSRTAFRTLVSEILSERPILQRRLGIDPDGLYDTIASHEYADIVNAIGMAYARQHGKVSWGDKTPAYLTQVDILHRLFPTSKMIYIVRDGRDVALSLMRKSWGPATIYTCARKWHTENAPHAALERLRAKHLLYELRYEDLLAAPFERLTDLLAFLGEDPIKARVFENAASVDRANGQKWERDMTPSQRALFDSIAGDTLRRFGYAVTSGHRRVGPIERFEYQAHDAAKHWANLVKMNVLDTVLIRFFGKQPFAG